MELLDALKNMQLPSIDTVTSIALLVLVVGIIFAVIKKALWLAIAAVVLSSILGISQPSNWNAVKDKVSSTFNVIIEPFKGPDYSSKIDDMFDNAVDNIKDDVKGEEKGEDTSEKSEKDDGNKAA